MSNRKLAILGTVAAVMVILVAMQGRLARGPEKTGGAGSYLIQGLEPAQIAGIEIGKGDEPLRIERQGGVFVVVNKDGYPASVKKINNLLNSLLDIRIVDWVTDNPENYDSLGVSEEKAQNVVRLLDVQGQVITGVVLGSSKLPEMDMERRTTYVRRVKGDDVYEAKDVPLATASATDYIEREIVNVDDDDVKRVTVSGPDDMYTLRVEDGNDERIVLDRMPAGRELKESTARQVMSALSYLSLSDVKEASSFAEGELAFDRTYVSELKDGRVYSFGIARPEGKTYVRCSAGGSIKERAADLVEFNKRHKGWVYEVPQYKGDNLTKKMTELLEEVKEEPTAERQDAGEDSGSEQQPKKEQAIEKEAQAVEGGVESEEALGGSASDM